MKVSNWKDYYLRKSSLPFRELCSKLSKTVGIISKLRYNVNVDILTMLYYSLIYPFLIYGVQ